MAASIQETQCSSPSPAHSRCQHQLGAFLPEPQVPSAFLLPRFSTIGSTEEKRLGCGPLSPVVASSQHLFQEWLCCRPSEAGDESNRSDEGLERVCAEPPERPCAAVSPSRFPLPVSTFAAPLEHRAACVQMRGTLNTPSTDAVPYSGACSVFYCRRGCGTCASLLPHLKTQA